MSQRSVDDVKMLVVDNVLHSLRFRIRGGETGDHFVSWFTGEWHCDCIAWMSNKQCRHVKTGEVLLESIQEALKKIEQGERENWKKT